MPKQTILFTGAGDDGTTGLLGAERVSKYDLRPEAYGAVDEATSFMGLARAEPDVSERTKNLVLAAQRDLWILMGELATASNVELPKRIDADRVAWLETEAEKLGAEFPPLTQFVIPGETRVGALLDVARTVVRRAERGVVKLADESLLNNRQIIRYLNRLSSLLFALARYEEHRHGQHSELTKKKNRR